MKNQSESANSSIPSKINNPTEDKLLQILSLIQDEIVGIPKKKRSEWVINRLTEYFGSIMKPTVIELIAAHLSNSHFSDINLDTKPDWLDMDKFRRGQKFALDNVVSLFYSNFVSLFASYTFSSTLQPLIISGRSSTPYTSFQRYLNSNLIFLTMYNFDPWLSGTPANKNLRKAQIFHVATQQKLKNMSSEEFVRNATIDNACCPTLSLYQCDFKSGCSESSLAHCMYDVINRQPHEKRKFITQCDMVHIQFSLVGLCVTYPEYFGIHGATIQELEAFCHTWRGLGYLVGIDDEFNFCRGTLEEVKNRTRDCLEYWVKANLKSVTPEWEHMMRCIFEGLKYFTPAFPYEIYILELARIMNFKMPHLYSSMSYSTWIIYKLIRFYFDYGSRFIPGLRIFVNHRFHLYYQRASNFDIDKLKVLEKKSEETLDFYFMSMQGEPARISKKYKQNRFIMCIVRVVIMTTFTLFVSLEHVKTV